MKRYNVAVIGAGHMGLEHIKRVRSVKGANLYCVVDSNIERAESAASIYNADFFFDDYKKAINLPETDIVIIATYANAHLEIMEYAVSHGKHVLCEKPMTPDIESSKKFIKIAEESNSKVLIGHILRYHESFIKMQEMIDEGKIGSPLLIRMTHNHHIVDKNKFNSLLKDTSPIVDCGVHYIDIMSHVTGEEIVSCNGVGMITNDDCPANSYNYGIISVKLSGGSVGVYEAGWGNTIASKVSNEFIGPKGRISLIYSSDRPSHQEEGDLIEFYSYENKKYEQINVKCDRRPTNAELAHLIKMIEEDAEAKPTLSEVFRAFEVCMKADKKIRAGL